MDIHRTGLRRAWLPALVAAATLAACGGDDGGSVAGVSALAQGQQEGAAASAADKQSLASRVSPSGVPYANPASGGRYRPVITNGQVQPSLSGGTIEENAWVDTPVDSDGDGTRDRIHVRIVRPTETANGARTPVIVLASPYYAGLADSPDHNVDVELDGTPHPAATAATA
ncbi:CocE/NonD family hydrolase, partial [Burkholderia sp. Se-20378]